MRHNGSRVPALTREMIVRRFPVLPADDPNAVRLMTEAELDASFDRYWNSIGAPSALHLFGYGSLMWRPEDGFGEGRVATITGWHRRFCLWLWRWRGSRAKPGLMLAVEPGGACCGMVYRLAGPSVRDTMRKVWGREMIGNGYRPRLVSAVTRDATTPAITFAANRQSDRYAARVPIPDAARYIATAAGHAGPSAEYLLETVLKCEQLGIRDPMLWQLQELVARHLMRAEGEVR